MVAEHLRQEFESMFHLRPVGMGTEDFLFRAYPKDWTVARKPKIGPPKVRIQRAAGESNFHGRRSRSLVRASDARDVCFLVSSVRTH